MPLELLTNSCDITCEASLQRDTCIPSLAAGRGPDMHGKTCLMNINMQDVENQI